MKACSKCDKWKRDAEFYPDKRAWRKPGSLSPACKVCERMAAAARARARYVVKGTMNQIRDEIGRFRRAA